MARIKDLKAKKQHPTRHAHQQASKPAGSEIREAAPSHMHHAKAQAPDHAHAHDQEAGVKAARRRPGRDPEEASVGEGKLTDAGVRSEAAKTESIRPETTRSESGNSESRNSDSRNSDSPNSDSQKIEIQFFGSEFLRAKFPEPFDIAEAVASDWGQKAEFSNLPIRNELARAWVQVGLKKAKSIEKQVLESPRTEKVLMKALEIGMEAQKKIGQIKDVLKRR